MERVSTGIEKLDEIIGGYPKGKTALITGGAGTGKTIFALHFLKACCEQGKKCAYIATEETPEDLKNQARSFGWDFSKFEEEGRLKIIKVLEKRAEKTEIETMLEFQREQRDFLEIIDDIPEDADAVVVDNLGVFSLGMTPLQMREQLDLFVYKVNSRELTTLIICDDTVESISKGVELYSVYSAIRLLRRDNPYTNKRERVIDIIKMRNTEIPLDYIIFNITNEGIEIIKPSE